MICVLIAYVNMMPLEHPVQIGGSLGIACPSFSRAHGIFGAPDKR